MIIFSRKTNPMVVSGNPTISGFTPKLGDTPLFSAEKSTWVLPILQPTEVPSISPSEATQDTVLGFLSIRKGLFQTLGRLGKKIIGLSKGIDWMNSRHHTLLYLYMLLWLEMCIYASVEKQVSYVYCLLLIIPNKSHAMISLFWSSNSWMHETCFRIISKQLQNGSDVHFGSECITNITKLLFSEWCSKSRLTCLAMAHAQRIDL